LTHELPDIKYPGSHTHCDSKAALVTVVLVLIWQVAQTEDPAAVE
jgi:hypothetical protein